jgi:hypothetical protein
MPKCTTLHGKNKIKNGLIIFRLIAIYWKHNGSPLKILNVALAKSVTAYARH